VGKLPGTVNPGNMNSMKGSQRWVAGILLLVLAGIFVWLGNRQPYATPQSSVSNGETGEGVPGKAAKAKAEPAREFDPDLAPAAPARKGPGNRLVDPGLSPGPKPETMFDLPTDNRMLFSAEPEKFFMFVDRYTPGGQLQVWEGGSYGFVRNPRQTAEGTIFTKFHEGIDIGPKIRDGKGEPKTSNYGNYVVVLHPIGKAGVLYSLYAHLRSISVAVGDNVTRGRELGMLGYTGAGIDRRRAHVHLEGGLVLSEKFDEYYRKTSGLANPHGNFHGSNLIGMNMAAFLLACHKDPSLMPDQFIRDQEVYYKVVVPNRGHELDLASRYPWLRQKGAPAASWEISFTGPGLPVSIAPAVHAAPFASVSWVKPFSGYHSWNTRSLLGGSGATATLTKEGNSFLMLVAGDF
jgi:hypothetical protein